MKKSTILFAMLVLMSVFMIVVYMNTNYKRISEIGKYNSADITKISFQYNNPAIKGGTVENKEKIEEFLKYINSCAVIMKDNQTPMVGYYQMAVFFIGDKEVMRLMTYDNFIEINGFQYKMVKNELNIKEIDGFIKSIK